MSESEQVPETESDLPRPLSLDSWHRARGGRMIGFAGYWLPVQYEGVVAEHLWTRAAAGLFDVSHMGQLLVTGPGAADALERLLPADLQSLRPGRLRYSLLLAEDGGILDDLMVTNVADASGPRWYLVVNGATKWDDIATLREHLPDEVTLNHMDDRALLALQGPHAAAALARLVPAAAELAFMQGSAYAWNGHTLGISRSGYTGEDGFEISVPADGAEPFADALCAFDEVRPVGLGARDSLRLEAGLPLYGHDLSPATDPVAAGLGFAISKRRREHGEFVGAERIVPLLAGGAPQCRVGLLLDGRMAAREGATILASRQQVGAITSGGFSPTLERAIAMGYVDAAHALPGTRLDIEQRGRLLAGTVVPLPFVPHRYRRKGGTA